MNEIEPRHVKPPSVAYVAASCMTAAERFWWVVVNIFTLGYPWWRKACMKRAFLEALEAHGRLYRSPLPLPTSEGTRQRGYSA